MKKRILLALILLFGMVPLVAGQSLVRAASGPAPSGKIDPRLLPALEALQPGEMLTVIVTLRRQADLQGLQEPGRPAQEQAVILRLQETAGAAQPRLLQMLKDRRNQGFVRDIIPLWIFDGISVTATKGVIDELAQDRDVVSLLPDQVDIQPANAPAELNVSAIYAPDLWDLGWTGRGVVVAGLDSGVDVSHPDLGPRWRGGSDSWYDPYGQHPVSPVDLSGHGTWTMGALVGGDSGGTSVGVAPGAQWIAARIFNDQGGSTATAIHQAFQWLLDPDGNPTTPDAPQVVNNSWSYANPGCYLDFELDLQSLRAVGILPVFASGNGGPYSSTSYSPANNPSAFAVGATDNTGQVYAYSSRGPSTCGGSTGVFPELVAPGVNIRTPGLGGGYAVNSGTSLSAPHAAGALALLLSAFPNLSTADQESALKNGAVDLGPAGPDDTYGFGGLNALAAYNWLAAGNHATPTPLPTATAAPTLTPTPTPTPAPTQAPKTAHIGDLDRASPASSKSWTATVTILVHDANEKALAGATVAGKWTNGASGTVSCKTGAAGTCQVSKTGLKNSTTSVTFTVTGVTYAGLTYQSGSNHDPDGDSNGTVIAIPK